MRPSLAAGLLVLFSAWVWPWPQLALPPFTAHMAMHMAVVALAAPLLALGIRGTRFDPAMRAPVWVSAIPASMGELVAVWAWHAPALHHAARHHAAAFALEQGTFLIAGVWLWSAAVGGSPELRRARAAAGVTGLLLTSMHMTLLGALIALAGRVLYPHHHGGGLSPIHDQQLGGAVMLLAGGIAYLAGGVGLTADALRGRAPREAA